MCSARAAESDDYLASFKSTPVNADEIYCQPQEVDGEPDCRFERWCYNKNPVKTCANIHGDHTRIPYPCADSGIFESKETDVILVNEPGTTLCMGDADTLRGDWAYNQGKVTGEGLTPLVPVEGSAEAAALQPGLEWGNKYHLVDLDDNSCGIKECCFPRSDQQGLWSEDPQSFAWSFLGQHQWDYAGTSYDFDRMVRYWPPRHLVDPNLFGEQAQHCRDAGGCVVDAANRFGITINPHSPWNAYTHDGGLQDGLYIGVEAVYVNWGSGVIFYGDITGYNAQRTQPAEGANSLTEVDEVLFASYLDMTGYQSRWYPEAAALAAAR